MKNNKQAPRSLLSNVALKAIGFYQAWSKNRPPRCRFVPSCSEYGKEAIYSRGFFKGAAYSIWRICRCNPFGSWGYDPPPEPTASLAARMSCQKQENA